MNSRDKRLRERLRQIHNDGGPVGHMARKGYAQRVYGSSDCHCELTELGYELLSELDERFYG